MNTRTFPVSSIANGSNVVVGPGEQFNWAESGTQSCTIAVQGTTDALSSSNNFNVAAGGTSSTAVNTPGTTGSYSMTPGGVRPNSIPFSIIVGSGHYDVASNSAMTGTWDQYFILQNDGAVAASVQCTDSNKPNFWPSSGYSVGPNGGFLNIFVPTNATNGTFQLQITAGNVTLSRPRIIIGTSLTPGPQSGHEHHKHHEHHEHKR